MAFLGPSFGTLRVPAREWAAAQCAFGGVASLGARSAAMAAPGRLRNRTPAVRVRRGIEFVQLHLRKALWQPQHACCH